jgi:hypothetical protein
LFDSSHASQVARNINVEPAMNCFTVTAFLSLLCAGIAFAEGAGDNASGYDPVPEGPVVDGECGTNVCRIPAGKTWKIDRHTVCRIISNNNPRAVMIPTRSPQEWSAGAKSFLNSSKPNMVVNLCPPTGGTVGGDDQGGDGRSPGDGAGSVDGT